MNTCRLCGVAGDSGLGPAGDQGPLFQYSTRHYAHAECGLKKWGAEWFDRLRDWQLRQFPVAIAIGYDVADELIKRIEGRK